MQFGQEADQVLQAAAEAIDRPSHYHIELAQLNNAGGGLSAVAAPAAAFREIEMEMVTMILVGIRAEHGIEQSDVDKAENGKLIGLGNRET
jgi:hypothetical protein